MSYFVNRSDEAPRRGKAIIAVAPHEEKGSGRRRHPVEGDMLPSMVGRGETRDEVLDRKVTQLQQQQSLLSANHIDDPNAPPVTQHKRLIRPPCGDSDSSAVHLFGPPKADVTPAVRLRPNNADDEKLRAIWAPPDSKKDAAADRFAQQPTMVERMMAQNFPLPHPAEKGPGGRSARTERNASQISIGGFVPPPCATSQQQQQQPGVVAGSPSSIGYRAHRRRVDVDYAAYVPDLIPHKAYYAVDGRMVAASEGAEQMKNFFTGEPLLCGRFVAEKQPQYQYHNGNSGEGDVPEPPARRSFEHGRRVLQ